MRAQREALLGIADPGISMGRRGVGGDETLDVDARLEDAAVAVLRKALPQADILTEEQGLLASGSKAPARLLLVLDPVDGSANARRGLPGYALSLAVASGSTMNDVFFGFVYDFASGEHFAAHADGWTDLPPGHAAGSTALVAIDSVEYDPSLVASIINRLAATAPRPFGLRVIGSTALAMSHTAAGRMDCFLSAGHCRPVDFAAAQLIGRAAGASITCAGRSFGDIPLNLERSFRPMVAWEPGMLAWAEAASEALVPDVAKERAQTAGR